MSDQTNGIDIKHRDMERLAAYQEALYAKPRLRMLFFELTDCCNMRCKHCGSRCEPQNGTFMDRDVIRKVLEDVSGHYNSREIMICFTGGEPMLYPGLPDVIRMTSEMGFPSGMTTNATLINDAAAQKLIESRLRTMAVSFDGLPKTHEEFRNAPGAFQKALDGVHALRKYGFYAQALTIVHKDNFNELEELYRFFREDGFLSWRLSNIDPIGRAKDHKDLLLDGRELRELYDFIRSKRFDPENSMEVTYACSHFVTLPYERMIRDFYFQCDAGLQVASVMANGDIGACLDIERRPELIQGNAVTDSFSDVWEHRFEFFRRNRAETSPTCRVCDYKTICRGDSTHTWDFERNEPAYCAAKMIHLPME